VLTEEESRLRGARAHAFESSEGLRMKARYLSFVLGTGRYCVPVDQVMQIVRPEGILRVPTAPRFVTGVISLRGDVIPVVDLKERLGISEGPGDSSPGGRSASRARIVVITAGNRSCGLSVDEVREIVDLEESADTGEKPQDEPSRRQFIRGAAHRDGGLFLILDLQRVLSVTRDLAGAGLA
jgi:purine-binding chemotaxis protein CheW